MKRPAPPQAASRRGEPTALARGGTAPTARSNSVAAPGALRGAGAVAQPTSSIGGAPVTLKPVWQALAVGMGVAGGLTKLRGDGAGSSSASSRPSSAASASASASPAAPAPAPRPLKRAALLPPPPTQPPAPAPRAAAATPQAAAESSGDEGDDGSWAGGGAATGGGNTDAEPVVGLAAAKAALTEACLLPLLLPPHVLRGVRSPPSAILLFGPPGECARAGCPRAGVVEGDQVGLKFQDNALRF